MDAMTQKAYRDRLKMSVLSRKQTRQQPQVVASDMFFNFTPQTHPGVVSTNEELQVQQRVMSNMQKECSELFTSNRAVKSEHEGVETYHTSGLYGTGKNSISVQELRDNMKHFNLSCSVSFSSPSSNTTTLAMLDSSHLTDDILNTGSVELQAGERGIMLVSFKQKDSKHYIQSVDYKVPLEKEEDRL